MRQLKNRIPAAHGMHQVAEFLIDEWIMAQVMDYRASISACVGVLDLVRRMNRKALQQQSRNFRRLRQVYDSLMFQDGTCKRCSAKKQRKQSRSSHSRNNHMPSFRHRLLAGFKSVP